MDDDMSQRAGIFLTLALLPFLASCQPEQPDFQIGMDPAGKITFNTKSPACLEALQIYDREGFVWNIVADACGEKAFPIVFGSLPQHFKEIGPQKPLVPGRRYGISICGGDFINEARAEFVMPTAPSTQRIIKLNSREIESPYDRDDARRAAAIEKGEFVPTIESCSRAVVVQQP